MIAVEKRSRELAWYHENRETFLPIRRERDRKRYAQARALNPPKPKRTPEQIKERHRQYYLANRQKYLDRSKRRAALLKGDLKTEVEHSRFVNRRIAQRKSSVHPATDKNEELKLFYAARRKTDETGIKHEVDHIIPLVLGGVHHHLNMQVLPVSVNRSKGYDPFWERPGFKSWRDVPEFLWPEKLVPSYLALRG